MNRPLTRVNGHFAPLFVCQTCRLPYWPVDTYHARHCPHCHHETGERA